MATRCGLGCGYAWGVSTAGVWLRLGCGYGWGVATAGVWIKKIDPCWKKLYKLDWRVAFSLHLLSSSRPVKDKLFARIETRVTVLPIEQVSRLWDVCKKNDTDESYTYALSGCNIRLSKVRPLHITRSHGQKSRKNLQKTC